jgi:hypothetical protein
VHGSAYWMGDIVKSYDAFFDEMNKAAADNYSVSVSTEKIKEICEGKLNGGIFILKMGGDFLNLKRPKPGEVGYARDNILVETVGGLLGKQTKDDYSTHSDWKDIERDVVLSNRFFKDSQTPVTGLTFGSAEPTAKDVEKIREAAGWTTEDLAQVTNAFGYYSDSLSFLKSQYNSNQRTAKTK